MPTPCPGCGGSRIPRNAIAYNGNREDYTVTNKNNLTKGLPSVIIPHHLITIGSAMKPVVIIRVKGIITLIAGG